MKAKFTPFVIASLATGLTACAGTVETTTPHLDEQFGQAVSQAVAQQTINPDASRNADPVAGMDGKAAKAVMDAYHEGLKQPPEPATVINIGGSLGGN